MRFTTLLAFISPIALLASHTSVTYLDLRDSAIPLAVTADSAGNIFVASEVTELSGVQELRLTKADQLGNTLESRDLGGIPLFAITLAVDSSGDVVLAGNTDNSPKIPLVSPLIANASLSCAVIIKFDAGLQNILFSTLLGGRAGFTQAKGLGLDRAGNISVTGFTTDPQFPVTPGAYQPPLEQFGTNDAFITEISTDGKRLILSTRLGGDQGAGDAAAATTGTAVAIDANGNIVLGGSTNALSLPVGKAAFGPHCGACTSQLSASFVAEFDGVGKLLWASYIPMDSTATVSTTLTSLAFDSTGNVVAVGNTSHGFPVTPGALQTTFPQPSGTAGFVMKADSQGDRIIWATYFGGGGSSGVSAVTIDSSDTVWITGTSLLAASLRWPREPRYLARRMWPACLLTVRR